MSRRIVAALAAVLVIVGLLTAGSVGAVDNEASAAASLGQAVRSGSREVLRFLSVHRAETTIDHGPSGFSAGDQTVFSDRLRLRPGGRQIGSDAGSCTVAFAGEASAESTCVVSFRFFSRGTVTAQALYEFGFDRITLAVTGGTGEFADVGGRGWMRANGRRAPVVLRVRHLAG